MASTYPNSFEDLTPEQVSSTLYGTKETFQQTKDFNQKSLQPWLKKGLEPKIPKATLDKLLAVYKANPSLQVKVGEGDGGETFSGAQGVTVDGYTIALDPNTGKPMIGKSLKKAAFGTEAAAVYGPDGNLVGVSSGDSTALGVAKAIAMAAGAYYAQGAIAGMEGAAGGVGASGGASGGTATGGLQSVAAGGASGGTAGAAGGLDLVAGSGLGEGLGGTLVGDSVLTSGGTSAFGTTLADGSLMASYGGTALGGTGAGAFDVANAASNVANNLPSSPPSNNGNNKTTNTPGLDTVGKLAGTALALGGAAAAGNALSNPVDTDRFGKLFDGLLAEQQKVSGRGDQQWASYLSTFQPLEQKMAKSALEYDSPTRREAAARDAMGQVATNFDQDRMAQEREMIRMGMDPTTIQALQNAGRIEESKSKALAANQARTNIENTGLSLVSNAAGFGRNLTNTAMQASGTATGTAGTANSVANTQANIQRKNTNDRNALVGDALGAAANLWGMYNSSKKIKKVGGKVDGLAAVAAVEKTPAKHWAYKPGEGDGNTKPRMGPMAEDLHKQAPGVSDGKKVDPIAMIGLQHAAIGNLAKRVRKLEKAEDGVYEAAEA